MPATVGTEQDSVRITSWIDDDGWIMCPFCNLMMGWNPEAGQDGTKFFCGGGHYIHAEDVWGVD